MLAVAVTLAAACRDSEQKKVSPAVPLIEADVLTLRSTSSDKQESLLDIMVARNKVRFSNELDSWRLIDLEAGTVTFVDAVAETYRTKSLQQLAAEKRRAAQAPLPPFIKPPTFSATGRTETIAGVEASEWVLEMGDYRRELWLSRSPLVHPRFLALSVGSEELGGAYAAAMAPVHTRLMSLEGFPLRERITVPLGKEVLVHERRLERRGKKRVPRALLELPPNYRHLTNGGSADGRRDASSPPSGRTTPEAGSRSSAKSGTAP